MNEEFGDEPDLVSMGDASFLLAYIMFMKAHVLGVYQHRSKDKID